MDIINILPGAVFIMNTATSKVSFMNSQASDLNLINNKKVTEEEIFRINTEPEGQPQDNSG